MESLMQTAVRHHRAGRIQDAGRVYQAVLARDPEHADALHLLGVVAHQLGRHPQAASLIVRSIDLRPNAPERHADLAEVYRAMGRLDEATACCRAALRLRPNYPEALNNLGLALVQGGKVDEGMARLRDALALRPDFASAHNNLADALREQGDGAAALEHFRQAVRCDPRMAVARSNLGQLLRERNRPDEALEHAREAVRLRPDFAEAHGNLGNVLRELGRFDEARSHYLEAIRINPRIGVFHGNLARLLMDEGRIDEALGCYQRALILDGDSSRIRCQVARALAEQNRSEEAEAHYEAALRLDARCAEAHNGLGLVLREQGRYEPAKRHFERALEIRPESAQTCCNLGDLLEELNEFQGAESWFRTALRHDPDHAGALSQLATLLRERLPDDDLSALRRRVAAAGPRDDERAALHFGLAHALDGRRDYAEAAENLRQANRLALDVRRRRGESYDPAEHAEFTSGMLAACGPAFFDRVAGLGLDSERPVFIVGLPRSGTTLIEQVLASHCQIFGAGELRLSRKHLESLPEAMNSTDSATDCLARLDAATIDVVGRRYLDGLFALSDAPRIVDKMPDNYICLGMLAALFPNAKLIHCRRDLRDTAVSCWMTSFRKIRWANDLDHIASRFTAYRRFMAHWRAVLPTPMLEIDYEETVADLESVARRLVEWCGLDWEPACLDFHKTARPVRTASVTQVRQPLYTRSVDRWKHYEPALGGLFKVLEALEASAS